MATYTLVQHSGFAVGADYQFRCAVEMKIVHNDAEMKRVRKAGGYLFCGYGAASDAETDVNYPGDTTGMLPRAAGTFAGSKIGGLRIYVPHPTDDMTEAEHRAKRECKRYDRDGHNPDLDNGHDFGSSDIGFSIRRIEADIAAGSGLWAAVQQELDWLADGNGQVPVFSSHLVYCVQRRLEKAS